jgi:N6-adenosine-specific RNA methylase IME4
LILEGLKIDGSVSRILLVRLNLRFGTQPGYDPEEERKIRETLVEKDVTSFVIYFARGGRDGWEYFKSKFGEFKVANEEILSESKKAMALVTRISPTE